MPGALVTDFIRSIERGELETALGLLSEGCEYDNVPMGKVFGRDGVRNTLAPFLAGYDEVEWVVHHQVASGDRAHGVVMNERVDRFRKGDAWVELPVAGVFEVRDGLITLWRDYFDRDTLLKMLGA
ncbi:MAG: limonene-1,2-epoxide hydrolase family protein [Ilumatobacteraceae bacterium]